MASDFKSLVDQILPEILIFLKKKFIGRYNNLTYVFQLISYRKHNICILA